MMFVCVVLRIELTEWRSKRSSEIELLNASNQRINIMLSTLKIYFSQYNIQYTNLPEYYMHQ